MPVRLPIYESAFRDEDGNETDATFRIRRRMSFDAEQRQAARAASLDIDISRVQAAVEAGDQEQLLSMVRGMSVEERAVFAEFSELSLTEYLLAVHGLQWDDGTPVTCDDFTRFDPFYVNQVVAAIQQQTTS